MLRDSNRGVSRGNKNVGCGTSKTAIFCTCGLNNWETVEDRWVHAARQFVSIELSILFPSIQHLAWLLQGRPQGKQKCGLRYVKTAVFFTFVDHVKTNKHMLEFFSPSGSHTILVYRSYTDTKHRAASLRQQSFLFILCSLYYDLDNEVFGPATTTIVIPGATRPSTDNRYQQQQHLCLQIVNLKNKVVVSPLSPRPYWLDTCQWGCTR